MGSWSIRRAALSFALCFAAHIAASHTSSSTGHDNMPATNFSCIGKVIGGYYADVYTKCQMFHVCTLNEKGSIHDYTFLCLKGTVFDQETRVCERFDEVDCSKSESFYHLNNDLYGPGIIPSTADSEGNPSAAKVQVLEPTVALMGAPDPPTVPTDTSEATLPPGPHSQSQPLPTPTSSPLPPVVPPGVTASTTRMSTSTSSSITAAYSFPPLPFTITRTSTSVSASSRVRIQTPLAQISFNQGVDPSVLPAPHLRPSLLRLAAEAQNAAQAAKILEDHNPTSSPAVTVQTPANFEDVPRLSVFHLDTSGAGATNNNGGSSHRRKRQLTHRDQHFSPSLTQEDGTLLTATAPTSFRLNNQDHIVTSTDSFRRTISSRGRIRFRQSDSQDQSLTVRQPVNPVRDGSSKNRQQSQAIARQRGNTVQNRQKDSQLPVRRRIRPLTSLPRIIPVSNIQIDELVSDKQHESQGLERQNEPSLRSRQHGRIRVSKPISRAQVTRRRPVSQTFTQDSSTHSSVQQGSFLHDSVSETPLQLADPTPVPPTVLTAEFPPDSHIRVFDGDEATARTHIISTPDFITPSPFVFPETSFSCVDKILGGLYADVETGCVVFHICSVEPNSRTKDNKFVCGSGTLFDQKTRTCQTAAAVDCAKAPSFYYLNEPFKGPVHVEVLYPEHEFDFPRIPSSPLTSSNRGRRSADGNVDLCRTRPLGTPLADLTTGCQDYTVCEALSDNRLSEKRFSCKKGYLFSQLRQHCTLAKKVNCAKETLSEILGMGSVKRQIIANRKRRAASLLQSHRFRRAALPPLANLIITPGVEDARVRRALYNLAALQQWTLENAQHSTFIEVYALQTDGKDLYPKKVYVDTMVPISSAEAVQRYGYINRKKRDVANITVAEQVLTGNQTKIEEAFASSSIVTSPGSSDEVEETKFKHIDFVTNTTLKDAFNHPTIATTTIGLSPTVLPTVIITRQKDTASTSFVSPTHPAIPTTLSTVTISPERTSLKTTSTTTVTVTPVTVTVTTTKTIVPISMSNIQAELSPTGTAIATSATQLSAYLTTPLPPPSTTTTIVDSVLKVTSTPSPEGTSTFPNIPLNTENSTSEIQPTRTGSASDLDSIPPQVLADNQTVQSVTNDTSLQNFANESSIASSTHLEVGESPTTFNSSVTVVETEGTNITESSESLANSSTTEAVQHSGVGTSTTVTTLPTALNMSTEMSQTENVTASTNFTILTTTEGTTDVHPSDSVNVTSTVEPPKDSDVSVNSSTGAVTPSSVTPQGPFTRENLPETNFTCKDKKLEQFYPDPEANCQVFHYCSPGFVKKQVLDLKFLCTGATMFDVNTQKCEDMASVTCGFDKPTTPSTKTTESTTKFFSVSPVVINATHTSYVEPPLTTENTTTSSNITTPASTTESATIAPEFNGTIGSHENWNNTESSHHLSNINVTVGKNITFIETTDQSILETTTITEDLSLMQPEETVTEIVEPSSTTVEPTFEFITETDLPEIETVTYQDDREDIFTSTEGLSTEGLSTEGLREIFLSTTEFLIQGEPEITTELVPVFHPDIIYESTTPTTEEITDGSTTKLNIDTVTDSTPFDSSSSTSEETTTYISVSTNISAFSNHSASSEISVSSNVSVSSDASLPVNRNTTEAAAAAL
nr:mucin-2-like isoform X1 [Procambarus clarkii]